MNVLVTILDVEDTGVKRINKISFMGLTFLFRISLFLALMINIYLMLSISFPWNLSLTLTPELSF